MDAQAIDPDRVLEDLAWVRSLAARLVRDAAAADDLAQETWLRALERGPRGVALTRAWLGTVLRNLVRERARRDERRRAREQASARAERVRSTDELAGELELQGFLARSVLELEEPYRSTVLLRYVHDLEPTRIAQRLGVPAATVRSRLSRALEMLRARLDARHGGVRSLWMQAVAPWAIATGVQKSVPAASLVLTGVLMKAWTWGLAALLVVGLGGVWWRTAAAPDVRPAPKLEEHALAIAPPLDAPGARVSGAGPLHESRTPAVVAPRRAAAVDHTTMAVRGRVVDITGQPVANLEVFVGAEEDPFAADCQLLVAGVNQWHGRKVTSRADGTFEAVLARPGVVQVRALPGARHAATHVDDRARPFAEVEVPAEGIELVVVGNPWASLTTRLIDSTTGHAVDRFRVRIETPTGGVMMRPSLDGRIEWELPLLSGGAQTWIVDVIQPESEPRPRCEVTLRPGEARELVLVQQSAHVLRGRVLDAAGAPVEGATVFFGSVHRSGGEPFEPFRPRDAYGATTDTEGRYELAGTGQLVSAWHPEHATATVSVAEAWSIVLGVRATVVGSGAPGSTLVWDEDTTVRIENGAFRIEHVDPGAHRLTLEGGIDFGLRVEAGQALEVDFSGRLPNVVLDLGDDIAGEGLLLGDAAVFSLPQFVCENGFATLRDVLPGRYHLFLDDGRRGRVTIKGSTAEAEFGRADLTLLAPPGSRIALSPVGADDLLASISARIPVFIDDSGRRVLAGWPAGRWTARDGREGEPRVVLVGDEPIELDLR